jgi:hypothetical protein
MAKHKPLKPDYDVGALQIRLLWTLAIFGTQTVSRVVCDLKHYHQHIVTLPAVMKSLGTMYERGWVQRHWGDRADTWGIAPGGWVALQQYHDWVDSWAAKIPWPETPEPPPVIPRGVFVPPPDDENNSSPDDI